MGGAVTEPFVYPECDVGVRGSVPGTRLAEVRKVTCRVRTLLGEMKMMGETTRPESRELFTREMDRTYEVSGLSRKHRSTNARD